MGAAGPGAAALSAWFGISPQQSWWSTYAKVQGVVDAAHWTAFALAVTSVTRSWEDWPRLLNLNLVVGLCVSVLAIARYVAPELPLPMPRREGHWPRIGASAGNPILLGAYLQAIALLATGFLVRSRRATTPSDPACRSGKAALRPAPRKGRGLRLFWAATAGCALAVVLALRGSADHAPAFDNPMLERATSGSASRQATACASGSPA